MGFKRIMIRNDRGFTLVELMIATFLTLIFAGAFFAAFYVMRNNLFQQSAHYGTNRAMRFTMDSLSRDVKEARRVVPSRGGVTTGDNVLILELYSINANGEPTGIAGDYDYVVYRQNPLNATQLIRSLDVKNGTSQRNGGADAPTKVMVPNFQSVTFSSGGNGLSSITNVANLKSIHIQSISRDRTLKANQTSQLDTNLMLRNK